MLKNAHDAATIRYGTTTVQAGSAMAASRSPTNVHDLAVVMGQVNGDFSDTTTHPDSPRMLKNGHDSTHGATKNEPDSATVELRFRPRPQSTMIHPECFKSFKIVVALSWSFPNRQDLPRITGIFLGRFWGRISAPIPKAKMRRFSQIRIFFFFFFFFTFIQSPQTHTYGNTLLPLHPIFPSI